MELNAKHSMKDNLEAAREAKARVQVYLEGGTTLSGFVGEVGHHLVVIKALTGRDFYDALVAIDAIAAFDVQTRTA
jgi:sRNA-binding regulator protein Hfq